MYKSFRQRIRLNKDLPSPTQICGGIRPQFQLGHPTQPGDWYQRRRIQTFPDNFFRRYSQGRVQTGNAVPVFVAKHIANQLKLSFERKTLNGFLEEGSNLELFK